MAKSRNNVVTHGLSGKIGDMLVFSQRNGQTIVGKVPKERTQPLSAKQQAQKKRFQEAILYGKAVMKDAALKEAYAAKADHAKGISSYNVALADLLHAPDINEIDLSQYTGKKNEIISISVSDDFGVEKVTVKIENTDGTLVEEGEAANKTTHWEYKTTTTNNDLADDKITVRAYDKPNNQSELQKEL